MLSTELVPVKLTVMWLSATETLVFSKPLVFVLFVILKLSEVEPLAEFEADPLLSGSGVTGA